MPPPPPSDDDGGIDETDEAGTDWGYKGRRRGPGSTKGGGQAQSGISEKDLDLYKSILREAWKDGILEASEQTMLTMTRNKFGIDNELHDQLEHEIKQELGVDDGLGQMEGKSRKRGKSLPNMQQCAEIAVVMLPDELRSLKKPQ